MGQSPAFANEIVLEHSHTHSLHVALAAFSYNGRAEWLQQRAYDNKPEIFTNLSLPKKSAHTCLRSKAEENKIQEDLSRQDLECGCLKRIKVWHWISDTQNARIREDLRTHWTNLLSFRKKYFTSEGETCSRSHGQLVEAPGLAETVWVTRRGL